MKLKKGDKVIVISGGSRGQKGTIAQAFPTTGKVLIDGVNVKKRHQRATRAGAKGTIVEMAVPIDASNVMLIDPSTGKPTRIGRKEVGGKMVRFAKKSGATLDK